MKMIPAMLLVATSAFSFYAQAVTPSDLYGNAAGGYIPQRTIKIDGNTRFINVHQNEMVALVDGKDSVTWHFDGIDEAFPLSKILPAAPGSDKVSVYVQVQRD